MKNDTPITGSGNRVVAEGLARVRHDEEKRQQVLRLIYPMRPIGYQRLEGGRSRVVSEIDVEMVDHTIELAWLINPGDDREAILTFTRPELDGEIGGHKKEETA
jgi:hypothetical protein